MMEADVLLEAVRKNGLVLKHVPNVLKTEELCSAAVEQNLLAFQHVPVRYKTPA